MSNHDPDKEALLREAETVASNFATAAEELRKEAQETFIDISLNNGIIEAMLRSFPKNYKENVEKHAQHEDIEHPDRIKMEMTRNLDDVVEQDFKEGEYKRIDPLSKIEMIEIIKGKVRSYFEKNQSNDISQKKSNG